MKNSWKKVDRKEKGEIDGIVDIRFGKVSRRSIEIREKILMERGAA